ncbi:hypothetical protein [Legionella spiritensis]|uniref:Uncharacterized protein n=1 Tax=Legionella spiritensis TaxID=452 RepID=A0A0W0Z6S8_LEGSP|nr:hypothetical protein [Legionella spiritensis]KTD64828.1 hypothetical protein Lspi_0995 [Legionella spiritensis]SNV40430.1 Uncharacterised protein [Legionella spiritensis]
MKKIIALTLWLCSSFAMATTDNNMLFLQSASAGELVKNKGQHYTLILKKSPDYVGYFTDRPQRKAGMVSLRQFIALWQNKTIKNNFSDVPPNAAIAMKLASGQLQNFVAVVSAPGYDNKTVSYQLDVISKQPLQTGKIVHANMFFDDIHWNPGGF